jgi:hypothetical protein
MGEWFADSTGQAATDKPKELVDKLPRERTVERAILAAAKINGR